MDRDVQIANDEIAKIKKKARIICNDIRDASENSPFMSLAQVLKVIPLSRSSIYLMMTKGEFPRPKKLGSRAAVWSKSEVDSWVADVLNQNTKDAGK